MGKVLAEQSHGNHSGIAPGDRHCHCVHGHVHSESHEEGLVGLPQRTLLATYLLESVFVAGAILLLVLGGRSALRPMVGDLAISFVAIMAEALPFMLLGSVVGGLIEVFVPQEWVQRSFGTRTYAAVFIGAALGIPFPVCECAIVPVVRRLLYKGVPLSGALAFLLGGPIVNPIVAGSTWLAYRGDWDMVLVRMVCGYVIAVTVALLVHFRFRHGPVLVEDPPSSDAQTCGCGHHEHDAHGATHAIARFWAAMQHACDDFFDVGRFLVIGAFVAAFCRTTIGVDMLQDLCATPGLAIVMMMGLAIALNLCSETDAFIAAGFRGAIPESAQMAFMVLGPMLDLKLILMYLTLFRKRVILILSCLTFSAVFAAMMLLHYSRGGLPGGP
jgi:uncharacterized protein